MPEAGARSAGRQRPRNRKDLLLAAAAELFRERGFHAVSISDIGNAVGITGPAVYRHFPSKIEVLAEAAERALTRISTALDALEDDPQSGESCLDRIIEVLVESSLQDWDFTVVYVREARSIPLDRRRELMRRRRHITGHIRRRLAAAMPTLDSRNLEARMWALDGVITGQVLFGDAAQRQHLNERQVRLLRAVLLDPVQAHIEPVPDVASIARPPRIQRREALLASAVQLIAEHGYHDVFIESIAEQAGITSSGMYRHFTNKQDFLSSAFRRAHEYLHVVTGQVLASSSTPEAAVGDLVERLAHASLSTNGLLVVYLTEGHNLPPEEREFYEAEFQSLLLEWSDILRRAHPLLDAAALMQAGLGLMVEFARRPEARGWDVHEALTSLVLGIFEQH